MIQKNNNFSVLPFYSSIDEQNHKKKYAYGNVYPLFTPKDRILPFQIVRDARANVITSAVMYEFGGGSPKNILAPMIETGLQIFKYPEHGVDVIVYNASLPMAIDARPGRFYLVLSDGVETWFSEVFTVVVDMAAYLKIEWYDENDLIFDAGIVSYKDPLFRNTVYFANELGKPEYLFTEEAKDRDGYLFPEKMISEKVYKTNILAPEFLCDVMRFIRLSDYVLVTDNYGRTYDCDSFLITPKWETQGDIASVEIEFQTKTVVKKIGKGIRNVVTVGDYNNDYNNDFNS